MNERILILDDEVENLDGLRELLRDEGYDVLMLSSPFELPFLLRSYKPNVILVDLGMPALRGETLLKIIPRKIIPEQTSILLFSGASANELETLASALGVDGYISKGEDLNLLLERLAFFARRKKKALQA